MTCKAILIVEDDLDIREALQTFFEQEGYPVLLAGNGQEALDLLETGSTVTPGLIFLDFMMPVMDGRTFLLELERIHPKIFSHTPIFIMSAWGDIHKMTFKTTGLVKKPFDLRELSRIAAKHCFSVGQNQTTS